MDRELIFSKHAKILCCLHQICTKRHKSFTNAASAQMLEFISITVDYGNAIYSQLCLNQVNQLQSSLNTAAQLTGRISKFIHVLNYMRNELCWLPMGRLDFMLFLVLTCKNSLTSCAPSYCRELCFPVSPIPGW